MNALKIVRVGGSLYDEPAILRQTMDILLNSNDQMAIVAGSGYIRHQQNRWLENAGIIHSQEKDLELLEIQRKLGSHLLSSLHSDLVVAQSLDRMMAALLTGQTPILLPNEVMPSLKGKRMGSDTAAAHLAAYVSSKAMIKLTNVDGIYDTDRQTIPVMDCDTLESMGQTSIDKGAAEVMRRHRIGLHVLNGLKPDNLENFLSGTSYIGTQILSEDGGDNEAV